MVKSYKLKPEHPHVSAFEAAIQTLEDLGIHVYAYGTLCIEFKNDPRRYQIVDIDSNEPFQDLPPLNDFKLTFERHIEDID